MEEINKVFEVASSEQRDYLWCLRDTFARSREINNLKWQDINFEKKTITLFTRKKKHGTRTPREIPLTENLYHVLLKRFRKRDEKIPWVFWHTFYSKIAGKKILGPFKDRK